MTESTADSSVGPKPGADDVQEQILALVRAKAGGPVELTDTLALLDVDSVATAELSLDIEKQFSLRVDEQIMDCQTVAELIDYVRRRRRQIGAR